MNVIIYSIKEATGAEIAVVTFDSLLGYTTIDELSFALANEWGIGEKDDNNGVLVSIAMAERRTRIEVGRGLESSLTDEIAGQILDTWMVPCFREDNFGTGFVNGVAAIAQIIALHYLTPVDAISFAGARVCGSE